MIVVGSWVVYKLVTCSGVRAARSWGTEHLFSGVSRHAMGLTNIRLTRERKTWPRDYCQSDVSAKTPSASSESPGRLENKDFVRGCESSGDRLGIV